MPIARPSVAAVLTVAGSAALAAAAAAQTQPVTFEDHIRPIMERTCWNCHGAAAQLSDLDLRTRAGALEGGAKGPALVPGRAEDSRLFRMVAGLDEPAMPMGGEELTDAEVAAMRAWIDQGAHWDAGGATSADAAISAWVVRAPMRTRPSSAAMPLSSATRPMSMRAVGAASRSFRRGIRLCPPASSLAPGWARSSRPISATESAR